MCPALNSNKGPTSALSQKLSFINSLFWSLKGEHLLCLQGMVKLNLDNLILLLLGYIRMLLYSFLLLIEHPDVHEIDIIFMKMFEKACIQKMNIG